MTTPQMIWIIAGMVLVVGGLVAIVIAEQIVGLAPFLAGVGIVMSADLKVGQG